jgi:hypothetical protein
MVIRYDWQNGGGSYRMVPNRYQNTNVGAMARIWSKGDINGLVETHHVGPTFDQTDGVDLNSTRRHALRGRHAV